MRLAKHLAHAGVASRRAAEQLVFGGRVTVDGETVTDPARDVSGRERIEVDGERIGGAPAVRVVYLLHKPFGVVSTAADTHGRPTVVDLVRAPGARRLYPVGRLDADSAGLILLTDDGDLAHKLTHPSFEVPKTYRVIVGGPALRDGALRRLRDGVELEDGVSLPAEVRRINAHELELTLREGRKRQVRRMCDAVGHPVRELRRVRFGPLPLGQLREGQSRRLTPGEVEALRAAADEPRVA
ncbi:MAG TPA: pseudouridine synthase [Solirubrobacteraceae bacterium]|nr:pseudouridine synthase [Solirubrobacteraceae bacterium]